MKMKIELIMKTQTEEILEMKNLEIQTRTTVASFTNSRDLRKNIRC